MLPNLRPELRGSHLKLLKMFETMNIPCHQVDDWLARQGKKHLSEMSDKSVGIAIAMFKKDQKRHERKVFEAGKQARKDLYKSLSQETKDRWNKNRRIARKKEKERKLKESLPCR
jgi:hypothetical protein